MKSVFDNGGIIGRSIKRVNSNTNNIVLLLNGNGTNGAQNNTFLDSSPNNFTITRNGNTTQGTFTPFSQPAGYWSNFFDGSGDFLSIADNAAFDVGSGNFTIEGWAYISSGSVAQAIVAQQNASASTSAFTLKATESTGFASFSVCIGGSYTTVNSNTATPLNAWNHFAGVRNGSTITLYLNGVSVGTVSVSTSTVNNSNASVAIGRAGDLDTERLTGYISNVRIVRGTAVYTANFTPSTIPLTAITNTSLLTCQDNRFIDRSTNNFAITRNGDTCVTAFSPFFAPKYDVLVNGNSAYFDASGDYLTIADNANLRFGTDLFTIEAWIYRNADNVTHAIAGKGATDIGYNFVVLNTNILRFQNFGTPVETTTTIPAGQWVHVAAVREGTGTNQFKLYINGVLSATATNSSNYNDTNPLYVGANRVITNLMNGYISNVRIVRGTAVYTSNFTPPTTPLTSITNTQLLLNFSNAGIFDSTSKHVLETVGNAQVETSVVKYGTGAMEFDGTGDYLEIPYSPDIDLLTGSFTVECWVYTTNLKAGGQRIFSTGGGTVAWNATTGIHTLFQINNNTGTISLQLSTNTGTPIGPSSTGTVPANIWVHVAGVYDAPVNTIRLFINGIMESFVVSAPARPSSNPRGNVASIPGEAGASGSAFQGYIDDLRIIKGVARYTANFTPPIQELDYYNSGIWSLNSVIDNIL